MHEAPQKILVTYQGHGKRSEVQLINHPRTPYRTVYRTQSGAIMPPDYHEQRDDAFYAAAKWVKEP